MFSTIFLCVKKNNDYDFKCKAFISFSEADRYYDKNYKNTDCNSTILSVCKFFPKTIKYYILQYKVGKIFSPISIVD